MILSGYKDISGVNISSENNYLINCYTHACLIDAFVYVIVSLFGVSFNLITMIRALSFYTELLAQNSTSVQQGVSPTPRGLIEEKFATVSRKFSLCESFAKPESSVKTDNSTRVYFRTIGSSEIELKSTFLDETLPQPDNPSFTSHRTRCSVFAPLLLTLLINVILYIVLLLINSTMVLTGPGLSANQKQIHSKFWELNLG